MDTPEWYAISVGGLIAFSIIACILLFLAQCFRIFGTAHFLKHLLYPQIPRFIPGHRRVTRFEFLVLIAFLAGNILAMTLKVKTKADFISRSAMIFTINLIPLAVGARMNGIASRSGARLSTHSRAHRWVGRVAIVQGLIHVAVAISSRAPDLRTQNGIAGLAGSIVLLLIIGTGFLKRYFYELHTNLHLLLVGVLTAAIFFHVPSRMLTKPPGIYLLVGICLRGFFWLLRLILILYRNVSFNGPLNRALIQPVTYKRDRANDLPVSDIVHVHVRLSRLWKPRAGQYVYICIPGVSYWSLFQSHPFYVAWWYRDSSGNNYAVLIVQKRRGFTKKLFLHTADTFDNKSTLRALIEGPYGEEMSVDSYGTVLLFATGIGIAGQLPYVTQLLEGYQNCEVKTRRVALFWEVESERHTAWVADRMQELLKQDTGRILDIHLFVDGDFLSSKTRKGDYVQLGERIDVTYKEMDPKALIASEIKEKKGRTIVSLCVNEETRTQIREVVLSCLEKDVFLEELDFQPEQEKGTKGSDATVYSGKRPVGSV